MNEWHFDKSFYKIFNERLCIINAFKKSLSNTYTQYTTLELTYVNGSLLFTYECCWWLLTMCETLFNKWYELMSKISFKVSSMKHMLNVMQMLGMGIIL